MPPDVKPAGFADDIQISEQVQHPPFLTAIMPPVQVWRMPL
jgi:hypothetical protein